MISRHTKNDETQTLVQLKRLEIQNTIDLSLLLFITETQLQILLIRNTVVFSVYSKNGKWFR